MFGLFNKEKWALVKSLKTQSGNYTYHIHLFESEKGKRRAEYKCDGNVYDINRPGCWLQQQDIYQLKIYRWLQGRRDPEIPQYSEIGEEDTANFLKGTI